MINWCSDKNVEVYFSVLPKIAIRYILPTDEKEKKKSKRKFPFINKVNLQVLLVDKKKNKEYEFSIPKGYCYDGASIPRFFWRLFGSNTDNKYLIAALIHDVLCENHSYIDYDREFSTQVFDSLLTASDVNLFSKFCMKHSVNLYQMLFCSWKKKDN